MPPEFMPDNPFLNLNFSLLLGRYEQLLARWGKLEEQIQSTRELLAEAFEEPAFQLLEHNLLTAQQSGDPAQIQAAQRALDLGTPLTRQLQELLNQQLALQEQVRIELARIFDFLNRNIDSPWWNPVDQLNFLQGVPAPPAQHPSQRPVLA